MFFKYKSNSGFIHDNEMEEELLVVENIFATPVGLFLHPKFSVVDSDLGGNSFEGECAVLLPCGDLIHTRLQLSVGHLSTRDTPERLEDLYPIGICLPDLKEGDLSLGSKLLVSKEVRAKVRHQWPLGRMGSSGGEV